MCFLVSVPHTKEGSLQGRMGVVFVPLSILQSWAWKPRWTSVADCPSGWGRAETAKMLLPTKACACSDKKPRMAFARHLTSFLSSRGRLTVDFGILRSNIPSRAPRCLHLKLGTRGTWWETVSFRCVASGVHRWLRRGVYLCPSPA